MTLEAGQQFESLLEYLRESRGVDFTGYKRASLIRRVTQRCHELGIDTFDGYLDFLQVHPEEFAILFDKLLINVTEFFRDRPAWDYVNEAVLPKIVSGGDNIRVWSTGTASGEEAYSVAILLCEALGVDEFLHRVKIYATDIDEEALNRGRSGYLPKELESLDPELRDRYFEPQGQRLSFKAPLRRAMIFGRHNLIQDAPISRLDLLICRNTLMYFTAETQSRILARFHYALKENGYLFLGRAEMLLTHTALFTPVDLKQRIFTKVEDLEPRERLNVLAQSGSIEATGHIARRQRVRELAIEGLAHAQIVVDASGVLIGANQAARRFFDIPTRDLGRPLKDLDLSYKPLDLRSPIDRVFRDRRAVTVPGVRFSSDGAEKVFDVYVAPIIEDDRTVVGASVSFLDMTQAVLLRAELDRARQEMETAYEELQSSNEELETTNEELQSTVEELETTNEELQSSNEELETMNEELDSTNAELQAINNDLRERTALVQRLNNLLLAITGHIEVGAAVLDPSMRVQVWNERAADLWGLRSDEVVGQRFFDLDIGLPTDELHSMIRSVDAGSAPDEMEVTAVTRRSKTIRCRVMAYTLADGHRPAGVVLVMQELKPAPRE